MTLSVVGYVVNSDNSMTLDLERRGWWTVEHLQVRGFCTVWYHYPSGERCSLAMENKCAEEWRRIQWKNVDSA